MEFKHAGDSHLFTLLHPVLIMITSDLVWYAKSKHDVDLVFTETVTTKEQDLLLNRTSTAHYDRIAADIRTWDIDPIIVADLVSYINNKPEYKEFHYLSHSGKKRLVYWHNSGHGDHLHCAIHSRYSLKSE